MPRKLPPPAAVAPIEALHPPPPPSPIVQVLRKDWRWAAISQFMWTFSDAFGLVDWDIEALEADFDGEEKALIPTLVAKLLFALTYNRQINRDNAFDNLRKQYAKRKPDIKCLLGTEEEPVEWATLGLGQKVGILHELCEWQLEDPARFRGLLKSEDDAVSWRIDPVGWDKEGNTYWLFDDNRLWIQRLPPPPPRPAKKTSQKAKKGSNKRSRPSTNTETPVPRKSHKKKERTPQLTPSPSPPHEEEPIVSGSRRRNQVAFYGNPTPTALALKKGAAATPSSAHVGQSGSGSRPTRSSLRSGGQANGHSAGPAATPSKPGRSTSASITTPLPLGTRVSRRLRNVDDEWQQVPDDWLKADAELKAASKAKGKKKKERDPDEESELSELTDEEEHEARIRASGARGDAVAVKQGQENGSPSIKEVVHDELPKEGENSKEPEDEKMDVDQVAGAEQPTREEEMEAAQEAVAVEETEDEPKVSLDEDVVPKEPTPEKAQDDPAAVPETNGHSSPSKNDAEMTAKTETMQDGVAPAQTSDGPEAGENKANGQQDVEETDDVKIAVKDANSLPEGFIEWEAVCVTLYDWRTFPEQFAKSKDLDEQALYELLTEEVGPKVIEVLVEKEQERIKQELINNRKRSSRIATRELEKEELARREQAEREMEERMEKNRLEEQRKAREEAELLAREKAREERLKEREERAAAREEALAKKAEEEQRIKDKAERLREKRKRRREGEEVSSDEEEDNHPTGRNTARGSRTATGTPGVVDGRSNGAAAGEAWELNCEVCRKTGWNLDDDQDVVCCDECGRWQHVECHDRQDESRGRPKRNWDQVDFKCKDCRHRAARKRQRQSEGSQTAFSPQVNGHHATAIPHVAHPPPHQTQVSNPPQPHLSVAPPLANAARPPPPPLQPGQYYLPYPHPQDRPAQPPAGYAVYYPPGQDVRAQGPPGHVAGYPRPSPPRQNAPQQPQAPSHPLPVSHQQPHPTYQSQPQQHAYPVQTSPYHGGPPAPIQHVQTQLPPVAPHVASQYPRPGNVLPPPHIALSHGGPYPPPHVSPERHAGYAAERPILPPPHISPHAQGVVHLPPIRASPPSHPPTHAYPRPSPPHVLPHAQIDRRISQGDVRPEVSPAMPHIAVRDFASASVLNGHGHSRAPGSDSESRVTNTQTGGPISIQQLTNGAAPAPSQAPQVVQEQPPEPSQV
ncbi:hypothetical protein CI109_102672 [Kwoniella shandongensis]|uniref:Uncharacterized protein n=1 Tax=Kwoniella shandongensis TaxID=1734106 RepID=A0A5M6BX63_9TREE|nr:uncharacterized protein CI109_005252 [Kwoniella shandongensis]KAA5526482.1 hypothetical protein CI109_005252 [Kwoniella shandongensis]